MTVCPASGTSSSPHLQRPSEFRHLVGNASQFETVTIPAAAEQMLMAGVTSVRDLAAPAQAILAVKKRIANGEIPALRCTSRARC